MSRISRLFDSVRNIIKESDDAGNAYFKRDGELHREDGPAVELADGTRMWFQNGERHRVDGPAIEHADGSRHWYQNNVLHRNRGAAIEDADGTRNWYHHGNLIALDDKAGFEYLTQQAAQKYARRDITRIASGEPLGQERMLTLDRGMGL